MGQMPPADLGRWAGTFSCYTAALAVWIAVRQEQWWRPLLEDAPTLTVRPVSGGLMRFEHHPRPPLRVLGLAVRHGDDWSAASAGYRAEMDARGAVVICGDTYHLPWQRGYRRWHAPHWFTVVREGGDWVADDPLEMQTLAGAQAPYRAPVAIGDLARWGIGPTGYSRAQTLRELGMVGSGPPAIGARYRWLTAFDSAPIPPAGPASSAEPAAPSGPADPGALTGRAAVLALADMCRYDGPETLADQQADDLWQALRQRELLIAAAEHDPGLVPPAVLEHWRSAIVRWRRIPPVLMETRLCVAEKMPVNRRRVADVIESVAEFEGTTVEPAR